MKRALRLDWRERLGIALVVLMSMALLLYVAWGEMTRTNQQFQEQRLQMLAQPLQAAINAHLQSGLPLEQFAGFTPLAAELEEADPQLGLISLRSREGVYLFETRSLPGGVFSVSIPVQNRFEVLGDLLLALDPELVTDPLEPFQPVLLSTALLFALLAIWRLLVAARDNADPLPAQRRVLLFMLLAQTLVISAVMWTVYGAGVRAAAQSQAATLASRLAAIPAHGLSLEDFSDLAGVLADERGRNGQVRELSLRVNGELVLRSRDAATLLDDTPLTELSVERATDADPPQVFSVTLAVPASVVTMAIARNLKNFAFLLVATVFMSMLLLRLVHGFTPAARPEEAMTRTAQLESRKASALLFLTVLCDQLSAAFLPPWVASVVKQTGLANSATAWAFSAYFLSFAATLLLAERVVSGGRPRAVMTLGALLVATGGVVLFLDPGFAGIVLARVMSGAGQAMVFVATQHLLLAWSRQAGALGANTSIVYQFNAGMICGMALGSVLVADIGLTGIFALVGVLACAVGLLAAALAPAPSASVDDEPPEAAVAGQGPVWLRCWRDAGFAVPALLIGIPAKAVMTGVVVYGLPLLLAGQGFDQAETGQLILFYAVGVLACNAFIAQRTPGLSHLRQIAVAAATVSALALAAIAGFSAVSLWLVAGILMLGLAHGAINAPVVTLVGSSPVAHQSGRAAVATYYRFVERVGHVAGPALFAQLMLWSDTAARSAMWMAVGLLAAAAGAAIWVFSTRRGVAASLGAFALPVLLMLGAMSTAPAWARADQAAPADTAPAVQVPWLALSPDTAGSWNTRPDPERGSDGLLVVPRIAGRLADRSVWMLVPKASPAYDVAISRMLAVFAERRVTPTVRIVYTRGDAQLAHELAQQAARQRVSLMVGVGSDITTFLHDHYRNGPVPLLSVCAKDPVLMKQMPSYEAVSGTSMAYTSLNSPVEVQLDYLQQARPALRNIAVVVDRRNASAWQTQALPLEALARSNAIAVHRVVVDSSEPVAGQLEVRIREAVTAMRRTDPDGAASVFWLTGSSAIFPHMALINRSALGIPVFSAVPDLVVAGPDSADVSIGVSFEENAHLAALYAQRILSGEKRPGELPVGVVSPPEIAINFMKTRQSGLRLPLSFFEKAGAVYNARGERVRWRGARVKPADSGGS